MNWEDLRNDLLSAPMVLVVMTFTASMAFPKIRLLGFIESDSEILGIKSLALVYVNETLNNLASNETDVVILKLDKNLATLKLLMLSSCAYSVTHMSFFRIIIKRLFAYRNTVLFNEQ